MIDKLLPRVLNKSKDNRLRNKVEMTDALNVVVGDDYDAMGVDDDGNSGVIKPVRGNVARGIKTFDIDAIFPTTPVTNRRVIGEVTDPRSGVVYMFIFSENAAEMGVYAYDAYGFFPGGGQAFRPIYRSSEFQFLSTGRVKGDIVHITGPNSTYRPILYFTDDINEPRKLDVLRCVESLGYDPTAFNYDMNSADDVDFITACPKAPLHPIRFTWDPDPDNTRPISNFRRIPGMQFAFQCVYISGEVSALSTYSDIAVPPQYLNQAYSSTQLNLPSYLQLVVPRFVDGGLNYTSEVERLRLLVRQGNTGAWYVIDELDTEGAFEQVVYNFYNDEVLTGMTLEEQARDFEAHPKVAQALAVVENRLMYGNYVEGFDEVPLDAEVRVNYFDRPQEFINIDIPARSVVVPMGGTDLAGTPTEMTQRMTGVVLDLSGLPETVPENTVFNCAISFDFGGSIDLYNSTGSFHASSIIGDDGVASNAQTFDTDNNYYTQAFFIPGNVTGGQRQVPLGTPSTNLGVASAADNILQWRATEEGQALGAAATSPAKIGMSGAAPLRFRGPEGSTEQLTFNVSFRTLTALTDPEPAIRAALSAAFVSNEVPAGFELLNLDTTATYSFNLGFQDPDQNAQYADAQAGDDVLALGALTLGGPSNQTVRSLVYSATPRYGIVPTHNAAHLDRSKLISVATKYNPGQSNSNIPVNDPHHPLGFFIVNQATLTFQLRPQRAITEDPLGSMVFTLELSSLSQVDVRTCVPVLMPHTTPGALLYTDNLATTTIGPAQFLGWRVFSGEWLKNNDISGGQDTSAAFADWSNSVSNVVLSLSKRAHYLGYLQTVDTVNLANPSIIPGDQIYRTNATRRQALSATQGIPVDDPIYDDIGTSIVDGEYAPVIFQGIYRTDIGSVGGGNDRQGYIYGQTNFGTSPNIGCYGTMAVCCNTALWATNWLPVLFSDTASLNLQIGTFGVNDLSFNIFNTWERLGGNLVHDGEGVGNVTSGPFDDVGFWTMVVPSDSGYVSGGPPAESIVDVAFGQQELEATYRSFKTNATHALGIVYYDERGRPGNVNVIDPVFVAGYSPAERGGFGEQGRVELEITLNSAPPPWAFQYQLVYGGSSTVQKFIQYSAGGAYIATDGGQEELSNIYVSLNYLQNHPTVSYAEAFGAVHPDGTSDLYVFTPGDYLRVISYFSDETTQVFPQNLIFEIAGQVTLTNDPETNPLYEALADGGDDVPEQLRGQFLILKDNQAAVGFNFAAVASAGNFVTQQTTLHNWNNRCIFEIITPRREGEAEELVYQETSQVYNVRRSGLTNVAHQTPTLRFVNGDVWWRAVPVNIPQYEQAGFVNLINAGTGGVDDDFSNRPRFRSVYLESQTFNDTFPNTDVNGLGKRKIYRPEAAEVRRFASIIFGDENNYSTPRLRFTVFNPSLAPFKDLPNEHGAINALLNYNDSLFVVQEDKASIVPVKRQIISDALGSDSLIATSKVLGDQALLPGSAGADNNRESVIKVDDTIYFAHKTKNQVYRYVPKRGLEIISDKGMDSAFVSIFREYGYGPTTRVVSGYDSLKDEYIITVFTATVLAQPAINEYRQPVLPTINVDAVVPGGTGPSGPSPDDPGPIIDGNFTEDFSDPANDGVTEIINTGGEPPFPPTDEDGWPPPDGGGVGDTDTGVISVANFVKDRIDDVFNGTAGTGNPTDPSDYGGVVNETGALYTYSVNLTDVMTTGIARSLGNFNGPVTSSGFNAGTMVMSASETRSVVDASGFTPEQYFAQLLAAEPATPITSSNYGDYVDFASGQLLGNQTVPQAMQVRKFYLADRVNQIIAELKGVEQNLVALIGEMKLAKEAVEEAVVQLGLNTDPNVEVLVTAMDDAYEELSAFAVTVLGINTGLPLTISLDNGQQVFVPGGFGNFFFGDYPLGAVEFNALQQFLTLVNNVGVPYNAIVNGNNYDISTTLGNLVTENQNLRANLDVITDQVQALSDAPSTFGANTFIPGVTSTQLESNTRDNIAGDGILTFSDVIRDFDPTLQFIIDNNSIIDETGFDLTEEVALRLAVEVFANLADTQLDENLPVIDGQTQLVDNRLRSTQERIAKRIRGLRGVLTSQGTEAFNVAIGGAFDPFSVDGTPGIGTSDLLEVFVTLGESDAAGNEINPFFPALPFIRAGAAAARYETELLTKPAIDLLVSVAESVGISDFDALSDLALASVSQQYLRTFLVQNFLINNVEAGTLTATPSITAQGKLTVTFAPVAGDGPGGALPLVGLEEFADPRFFDPADPYYVFNPIYAELAPGFYDSLAITGFYNDYQLLTLARPGIAQGINVFTVENALGTPENVAAFSDPATFRQAVINMFRSSVSGAPVNFLNGPTIPSPIARFGNLADVAFLSDSQRSAAVVNAINTINSTYNN